MNGYAEPGGTGHVVVGECRHLAIIQPAPRASPLQTVRTTGSSSVVPRGNDAMLVDEQGPHSTTGAFGACRDSLRYTQEVLVPIGHCHDFAVHLGHRGLLSLNSIRSHLSDAALTESSCSTLTRVRRQYLRKNAGPRWVPNGRSLSSQAILQGSHR